MEKKTNLLLAALSLGVAAGARYAGYFGPFSEFFHSYCADIFAPFGYCYYYCY